MPLRTGSQCSLLCSDPVTYSEHGHRLAGDYCDNHGMAVHRLRRGSPCSCRHCDVAGRRVLRKIAQEAVSQSVAHANEEASDAD